MKWILCILFFCGGTALAQEGSSPSTEAPTVATAPAKKAFYREDLLLGFSYLQWNEKMRLQQGAVTSEDKANFAGMSLSLEKNIALAKWGFAFGGLIGSGKASGGSGGVPISYQEGNQPWVLYGIYVKAYHKLTGRLYLGLTAPLLFRQVSWPESQTGISVTSGKNLNAAALIELNLRLNEKWDLYQGIGPFSEEGSTLWRLGLAYRF